MIAAFFDHALSLSARDWLFGFAFYYPLFMAWIWIIGGLWFYYRRERDAVHRHGPDHPAPIELIDGLGGPITGTSANISGSADRLNLAELTAELEGRVDYIVTEGPEPKGTASTVIDITSGQPKLLREGAIPFEQVLQTWEKASK